MFKVEVERGTFDIFEEDKAGGFYVGHGDTKVRCNRMWEGIEEEECKELPTFVEYTDCDLSIPENSWGKFWNDNKIGNSTG